MAFLRVSSDIRNKRTIALLSFLLPGLGQVYCGHYWRGVSLFAAFALLANFSEARLLLPLLALLAATEAYRAYGKELPVRTRLKLPRWLKPVFSPRQTLPRPVRLATFSAAGIVGFLAWFALTAPWFFPFASQMAINGDVEQLADGVRNFRALHGKLPAELQEVGVRRHKDPWNTPYQLSAWEEGFEIRSWGRDRRKETPDDLAFRFRR